MLHNGENVVDGIGVYVERKSVRRINIRIGADGRVRMSVPARGATLLEAEAFLLKSWSWVRKARAKTLERQGTRRGPATDFERRTLAALLDDLNREWTERLGEAGVTWRVRSMKSLWGSCHWRSRRIVYSAELAGAPRRLVEYVVVHELTHLQAHDHGPRFKALMDERLPGWADLRRQLNKRDFRSGIALVQPEFW